MTDPVIRKKIAALKRLARGGASEAEAMAALQKAAELMQAHGLSNDDIEFDEQDAPIKTKGKSPRDALWGTVGACTNCASTLRGDWSPTVQFVGRAPGPEIAVYLVWVLNRAIDREVKTFQETPGYKRRRTIASKRAAVRDFTIGLVVRLKQRLRELFAASMNSRALTAAQDVRDRRLGGGLVPISAPTKVGRNGRAAEAGYRAADKVQLAHGVNGGKPLQRIGGQ
jgi:hypothetical protein